MYEQRFNPFAANVEIVKGYFKKSKVLVIGILYIITAALTVAVSLLSPADNYNETMQMLNRLGLNSSDASMAVAASSVTTVITAVFTAILLLLTALAFILLFAKSRSADPNSGPVAGATILYVLAVISFVCSIIFTVIVAIAYVLSVVFGVTLTNSFGADGSGQATVLFVIGGVILAIFLFLIVFVCVCRKNYYRSVKYSLTTVELQNKGAAAWGVFSIIFSVFIGILALVAAVGVFTSKTTVSSILSLGVIISVFITQILDASIALGYSRYINRQKSGYNNTPYNSAPNNGYAPVPNQPYANNRPPYQQPYGGDRPNVPYNDNFAQQNAPAQQKPTTCPNCGAPVDPSLSFCGNCGTKL